MEVLERDPTVARGGSTEWSLADASQSVVFVHKPMGNVQIRLSRRAEERTRSSGGFGRRACDAVIGP